jgi:cell division protein ZapA
VKAEAQLAVVDILDKEYRIACPEPEREALLASARLVDQKMREVRDSGRVVGSDRIAVMAALNIAHDLVRQQQLLDSGAQGLSRRARLMQDRIDAVLGPGNAVEVGGI